VWAVCSLLPTQNVSISKRLSSAGFVRNKKEGISVGIFCQTKRDAIFFLLFLSNKLGTGFVNAEVSLQTSNGKSRICESVACFAALAHEYILFLFIYFCLS
jgi:hypothetical protein